MRPTQVQHNRHHVIDAGMHQKAVPCGVVVGRTSISQFQYPARDIVTCHGRLCGSSRSIQPQGHLTLVLAVFNRSPGELVLSPFGPGTEELHEGAMDESSGSTCRPILETL